HTRSAAFCSRRLLLASSSLANHRERLPANRFEAHRIPIVCLHSDPYRGPKHVGPDQGRRRPSAHFGSVKSEKSGGRTPRFHVCAGPVVFDDAGSCFWQATRCHRTRTRCCGCAECPFAPRSPINSSVSTLSI